MTRRAPRMALALLAFSVVGALWPLVVPSELGDPAFSLVFVGYALVGWLVTRKQPANKVGWLLLIFGALGGLNGFLGMWGYLAEDLGLAGSRVARWSQTWLWAPMLGVTFGPLLVLFPDGRVISPRWRLVPWLSGVFVVLAVLGNGLYPFPEGEGGPNPYALHGAEPLLKVFQDAAGLALMLSLAGGVAALVVRYRRAGRLQRQQLKWFLTAAAILPVTVVLGELREQALQDIVVPIGLGLLAAAMGIAILRHGLYDIDRIISRTVGWALVTVALGAIYLGAVTLLTSLTATVAGESTFAVAGSTLMAAAAFGPVRRRIQSAVDRRFNRARYDAARTIQAYRVRLRDDLDVESVSTHLQGAVASTLQPSATALWLRTPEVRL